MLILPLVLLSIASAVALFAYTSITGVQPTMNRHEQVSVLSESATSRFIDLSSFEQVEHEIKAYHSNEDGYVFVAPDELNVQTNYNYGPNGGSARMWIASLVLIAAIVVVSNILLTRFVSRGVMNRIDTLVTGVHEIRDGNFNYRIEQKGKDEFTPVCEDFNEMSARLAEMVEQKQKDEQSRRELIAGISHDLRTPLTSIKAYLEGLQKGVAATPEKEAQYLEIINSKAENLEYIINQLFMFSKLDVGELPLQRERVNMIDELKIISSNMLDEYAEEGLDVHYVGSGEPVYCAIDTVQFQNVLQNIIGNSLKYKTSNAVCCTLSCEIKDDKAIIDILDNGPGVSQESIAKLFEIFYREDQSRQKTENGSGIGLAISQKIIEQLGGTISARNGDPRGLLITITLPLCKGEKSE